MSAERINRLRALIGELETLRDTNNAHDLCKCGHPRSSHISAPGINACTGWDSMSETCNEQCRRFELKSDENAAAQSLAYSIRHYLIGEASADD